MNYKQINCFKTNIMYWKFLGLWPGENHSRYYQYYSKIFILSMYLTYFILLTINLYFLPRQLDLYIEEMVLFFTEVAIVIKVLTVYFMRDKIKRILDMLECEIFQPKDDDAVRIIENAIKFIRRYYKIVAVVSYLSNLTHVLSPLVAHIVLLIGLEWPVCSYSFIVGDIKDTLTYPIYLYQSLGMHFHMLVNVNTDSFILGLMILAIAQIKVLSNNLQRLTVSDESLEYMSEKENVFKLRLHKCIVHFMEIEKFCSLIEHVFSVCLFVQFSASSCIICVILFRFTMPTTTSYLIFLISYMLAMLVQIISPTWFGTRIMETSSSLSQAIYNCDWVPRPRQFKSSLMVFVERMNRPLTITACKMFPLLLTTFTKIMNTAYSFFTLLRNMQTLEP